MKVLSCSSGGISVQTASVDHVIRLTAGAGCNPGGSPTFTCQEQRRAYLNRHIINQVLALFSAHFLSVSPVFFFSFLPFSVQLRQLYASQLAAKGFSL